MPFNHDENKQVVQVIFSCKSPKPPFCSYQTEVPVVKKHKHLGVIFDSKLDFSTHVKGAVVNQVIQEQQQRT